MFIGAAGGVAFIFFVSAIGAISEFRTPIELARFVSISLIAGFGARRLLPMMAGHLEKQIAHAEQSASVALDAAETTLKKLQATEKRMGDTEAKLELVRTNANLLTAASSSVSRSMRERAQIEAEKAIAGITSDAGHDTTISAIYVNLARVYRHSGNLDRAIELLEELVRKMTQNELMQNGNLAIAHYNLACYSELRHRKGAAEEELDRAMSELERAVEVSDDPREILQCALTDPDLQLLQTKKRFRELLKRFDITSPETPGG